MLKVTASIITSIILLCLLIFFLIFSSAPSVEPPPAFTHEDISNFRKTLSKSNPFKNQRFKHQALEINEQLLNQLTNFTLTQISNISVTSNLKKNIANTEGSIKLKSVPFDLYLNFKCDISPSENLLEMTNIKLGHIPIPQWLADYIRPLAIEHVTERYPDYMKLFESVKKIDIKKNKMVLNYHWNDSLSKKIKTAGRNLLLDPDQQKILGIYYHALSELSRNLFWKALGLNQIIQPIFQLAKQRTDRGSDAIKENKAALLALGIMASGIRVNHLLQDENAKPFQDAYFFRLTLLKRNDLMKHFLISAALSISTNKMLSDTIGLSKEMDDSRGGSGFSFADLLADRAGVRLAQAATQNIESAKHVQQFLSNQELKEIDFMPPHDKLPEAISELEFKRKYIDVTHEKYLFVEQELQQRIASRLIYRFN